jgi:arsenate reductase
MFIQLERYASSISIDLVSEERKIILQALIDYIQKQRDNEEAVKLNFICTHNSRRSHLCQVWAKTMASYYQLENIKCYSGGTEATAVYPMIIKTLRNTGFEISQLNEDMNPTYKLRFNEEMCPMTLFSKTFDDATNPTENFAAVMTCGHADDNCPIIPKATRISVTYVDPKVSDGTPKQAAVYAERSLQIATEMKYVFSQIK